MGNIIELAGHSFHKKCIEGFLAIKHNASKVLGT